MVSVHPYCYSPRFSVKGNVFSPVSIPLRSDESAAIDAFLAGQASVTRQHIGGSLDAIDFTRVNIWNALIARPISASRRRTSHRSPARSGSMAHRLSRRQILGVGLTAAGAAAATPLLTRAASAGTAAPPPPRAGQAAPTKAIPAPPRAAGHHIRAADQ